MKKRKNVVYRKSVSLLAAAAMTAVLMTGQVYPTVAWGQNTETRLEKSSLIPENITIDEPVALSEIELPKSDYGTLSWADDSFVPDKRVQSCKVEFKPAADVDLSYLSGWDAEKKVVKGKITVVVTSLEGDSKEDQESGTENEGSSDNENSTAITGDNETSSDGETDAKSEDGTDQSDKIESDAATADSNADTEADAAKDQEADSESASDKNTPDENTSEKPAENTPQAANEDTETTLEGGHDSSVSESTSSGDDQQESAASASENGTAADSQENAGGSKAADVAADVTESTGKLNEVFGEAMPGATVLDGADTSAKDDTAEDEKKDTSDEKNTSDVKDTTDGDQKNIFDNPLDFTVAASRPTTAEDNLTEEEQAQRAIENHSCEGISVSGIDLPWYVQFQVTSGENYEFTNEDKATIFQSYEFKLWDLKNNTEYEIPDGQYVSVTIPVKEGYKYSIEHLLDNGATETIIPSVNGSTMVFSTHSFSPFGIAGFRPIVGEDIANGAYGDESTPTPTPTGTISGTPTPTPSVTGTASNGSTSNNGTAGTGSENGTTGGANGTSGTTGTASDGTGANGTTGTGTTGTTGTNGTDGTGTTGTAGAAEEGTGTSGTNGTASAVNGTGTATTGTASGQNAGQGQAANSSQNQTSNAVKTGDNTVILPFVILVLAAAVVIIIVIIVRKKRDK